MFPEAKESSSGPIHSCRRRTRLPFLSPGIWRKGWNVEAGVEAGDRGWNLEVGAGMRRQG